MVDARELVPGDVVILEAGDVVTADLRLIEASNLQSDESVLTGESVPVAKDTGAVAAEAGIGDRLGMAFKGTAITQGTGEGIVVATGMADRARPHQRPRPKRRGRGGAARAAARPARSPARLADARRWPR